MIDFQEDLRAGYGLEEALFKYNLNLKDAFDRLLPAQEKKPPKRKSGYTKRKCIPSMLNIYLIGRKYYIKKTINGKTLLFGAYSTLEDAQKVRDHCIKHGWIQKNIDAYCKLLGVTRSKHHNSVVEYS